MEVEVLAVLRSTYLKLAAVVVSSQELGQRGSRGPCHWPEMKIYSDRLVRHRMRGQCHPTMFETSPTIDMVEALIVLCSYLSFFSIK